MKHVDEMSLGQGENLLNVISKLQLAVAASRMGVWEYDEATQSVHWDDRMLEIYGITDGKNQRPDDFWERHIHPDDIEKLTAYAEECRLNNKDFNHDYRIIREDGTIRHIRSLARNVSTPGKKSKLVGVNIDVTEDYLRAEELRKAQTQLKHDARHDVLTGLGNRRALDEATQDAFDVMAKTDRYCLMLLDLDHFKEVNDELGHLAGDFVLKTVARIIVDVVGTSGTVFRIGGDEFATFFPVAPPEEDIIARCETIIKKIKAPIPFHGEDCYVGASIGFAFGEGPPKTASHIFSDADTALYEVKRNGRSDYRAYSSDLAQKPACVTNTRRDLLNALSTDAFICHYQPQFDAKTLEIIGAEALVRWQCPQRGLLPPAAFLPEATDLNLVTDIDERVLELVAAQQDEWHRDGLPFPTISVNTAAERLRNPDFIESVEQVLRPHHKIAFELLETAFLDDIDDTTRANLDALRARGIRIDLDDFGSGHSSVTALQTVRPHQAKIDRSLVRPIETNPRQIMTLQALCRIARLASAKTVVEGLESGLMLAAIRNVNCDALQGYALQRPAPASEFAALLHRAAQASA